MEENRKKRNSGIPSKVTEGYLSALSDFYVSGYYLDLNTRKYYGISQEKEYNDLYNSEGDWSKFDNYIRECINKEDQPLIIEVSRIEYIRERLKKEKNFSIEVRDHGTGIEKWYRYLTMRGADENHAAISFLDVTEQVLQRKKIEELSKSLEEKNAQLEKTVATEEELSASLNQVHEVLGSGPWKIEYDSTGKETKVEFSNEMRHLFGYENEADFPNTVEALLSRIHEDYLDEMIRVIYGILKSNDKNNVTISYRYRAYKKDGTLLWFHTQGLVKRNEDGTPLLAYGVIMDITDITKAENGQKEALVAFDSIHEALGSANWQMNFDEKGNMTECLWSDRFREMIGYQNEEDFPNRLSSWTNLLHPSDKKRVLDAYWNTVNDRLGKSSYNVEYRLLTKEKGYRWYSAKGSLTRYGDGTPKVFYGLFLDINEQVLSEQNEKEQLREISVLNNQLQDNQAELEAAAAEQEAQLKEISDLNEGLEKKEAELERSLSVVGSLSKTMHHLYLFNLKDYSFKEIGKGEKDVVQAIGSVGDARTAVKILCRFMVIPEQREEMQEFCDLSTLNDRLRRKTYIAQQFCSRNNNWYQGFFIAVSWDDDGNCNEILWALRSINDFKLKEIEYNKNLKEYNDIMADAGFGMWHIILKDGVAPRMQVNDKMAELLGITGQNLSEEELYNAWYDQIVPEAIPSVQASVAEMLAGHFSENTYQWKHPAKGVIYVRCGGTCNRLADGTNVLRGYHADVTDIVYEEKKHNEELESAKEKISEAYGMIEGFSQEYHTIWVVNKETSEMRLIRSNGKTTIQGAVQMGKDYPKFDAGFDKYIGTYVEPEDRERMHKQIAFAEILRQLEKGGIYSVNYLRRDAEGHVGYHQIAFANADTKNVKQFVYGFRDVDAIVKEEQRQKEELRNAYNQLSQNAAEQEAQIEEITALNNQLQDNQAELEASAAEQEAQLKEITELNEILEKNSIEREEQLKVVNALASDYTNAFLINAKDGTSRSITLRRDISEIIGVENKEKHYYKDTSDRYLSSGRIYGEDFEILKKNMDLCHVIRELENKDEFTGNYRVVTDGTIHYYQYKYKKVEDTDYIIFGLQNTDKIMEDEIRRNKAIEEAKDALEKESEKLSEAYGMIEGFSQEYHTIWVVNKETSEMRLIRSNGKTTIQGAVQMGKDYPKFDTGFDKYIGTYVEPEDRERMHKQIAFAEILRQLEKGGIYSVNYLRRDAEGHVGYHQIAFANADTKDVKQFVYGFRDVDAIVKEEQKQKEEFRRAKEDAESASKAKTSFLFNMSHDIRTPMNAIMGFRDLLEKHQDDPVKRQDYLNKISDSSDVLLSIINNVLEMARIEKGTLEIDETAWSTEQFNDTLYSVFHQMMNEKGINFTRKIEVEHHYVYCDPTKLREIFINILSNAYKYTNPGGNVVMHLEEIPCDKEGWVLYKTTISDTGIGMAEDYLPHIFEEFSREKNTTEAKIEGTGLGMPIVKRLVELLDGTIEVQSEKGKGSTFTVIIPHKIAQRADLVEKAGVEIDPKLFEGKRILLAEDNDLNAEIAEEILGEAGFIIERAEDGAVCVDMLKKAAPGYYDIILMDIQMPNMNGYEATKEIRKLDDEQKADIKILAMTANAFEEDKREALKSGMNGHIAKPINVNVLLKTLAGLIS